MNIKRRIMLYYRPVLASVEQFITSRISMTCRRCVAFPRRKAARGGLSGLERKSSSILACALAKRRRHFFPFPLAVWPAPDSAGGGPPLVFACITTKEAAPALPRFSSRLGIVRCSARSAAQSSTPRRSSPSQSGTLQDEPRSRQAFLFALSRRRVCPNSFQPLARLLPACSLDPVPT